MDIEDLKKVAVNLDSETAKQIAEQYIMFKYVDSTMAFVCTMTVIIGIVLVVLKLIRKAKSTLKH